MRVMQDGRTWATVLASGAMLLAGPALAGGFERSSPSLGFLFEPGSYGELSFGQVSAKVKGMAGAAPSGDVAESYGSVGLVFKMKVTDRLDLGLSLDPSFGADLTYPAAFALYPIAGTNAELNGDTVTLLGRYKVTDAVSLIGGVKSVGIGGNVEVFNAGALAYKAGYDTDRDTGYVLGTAYEKPDIALRLALIYSSATKHDLSTTVFGVPVGSERVEMPQSLTLEAQSGIAANTLLFGSVRWVDWSSTRLNSIGYPVPLQPMVGYDTDTISYTLGLGRKFSERWSGAVSIGYEKPAGGIASNLSPTDGYLSLGVGATYTSGKMKISGGVRYVDLGNANALENPPGSGIANAAFRNNSALGVGFKIGWTF